MGNRRSFRSGGFSPLDNSKISAWHRNTTIGAVSSVTDQLNTNPMTQVDTDRQPTGNADGSMAFSNKSLVLPMHASNNSVTGLGFAGWFVQPINLDEHWIVGIPNPGGTSNWKFSVAITTSRRLVFSFFTDGANGRSFTTAVNKMPAAGTPFWCDWFYDSTLGGDANLTLFINETTGLTSGSWANLGTGGTGTTLNVVTGNYFIGNFANSDAGSFGLIGTIGRNLYTLSSALTPAERTSLIAFEPLA